MENKVVVPRRAAEGQPFWAERIAAWKASGKSQAAFCGEQGLSRWTMRRWVVRLGPKARRRSCGQNSCRCRCMWNIARRARARPR